MVPNIYTHRSSRAGKLKQCNGTRENELQFCLNKNCWLTIRTSSLTNAKELTGQIFLVKNTITEFQWRRTAKGAWMKTY